LGTLDCGLTSHCGFDGVNSIVGSWLGLEKPTRIRHLETQRMAEFPNGHDFSNLFCMVFGKKIAIDINVMTPTKVFWLVVWTDLFEGEEPNSCFQFFIHVQTSAHIYL